MGSPAARRGGAVERASRRAAGQGESALRRAADEGALRPLTAAQFDKVPAALKDPDRTWVGIDVRHALIATSADTDAVDDYADLAMAALRGKVCLSSSALTVNRLCSWQSTMPMGGYSSYLGPLPGTETQSGL